jgi:acyl-homoserine lactone acylase PvdQ
VFRRKLALGVLAALAFATLPSSAAAAPTGPRDYSIIARDIVPSGGYGSVPTPATLPKIEQQAQMYNALTPLFNHVSAGDLTADFKPEPVDVQHAPGPITTEAVPHAGVTIFRDAYNVPYIYADKYDDLTWAEGWVEGEDQGLLLNEARYLGRIAALDAPGYSAIQLIGNLASFTPSQQTENELSKQTSALMSHGAKGRAVLHDIDVYLEGINAYQAAHGGGTPFTRNDIYAFNAIKDQFVGEGGGNQAANAEFLSAAERKLGRRRGHAVWNDLREANDPEAPASVPGHVRFQPPPKSTTGNVLLDPGSLSHGARRALAVQAGTRGHASNELMVAGWRSSTHHPIMVAGPQIHYYYPGLVHEIDAYAPGVHERGLTTATFPGYIFIGRSQDSAWSLTSAGLNQIDTYVETLCGHSTHRYVFKGHCRAMQFFDAGKLTNNGVPTEVTFWRTAHGPVIGYARAHGRLVALAQKRASYGKDVLDLLFYHDLAHGKVHNVHQFFRAADETPQTFNSFYMDDRDIGVFTSGLVPIRPANVDADLPINGTGREEWRGFVSFANHPHGINPPSGEIINWNNRPQAGYEAPSDNWSLGAIMRVNLLIDNLGHGRHITPARVVSAMNEAATQDVAERLLEPLVAKVLGHGHAPSARDAKMLALLQEWNRQGGSRLDRTGDGQITAPGAAILDTAFPLLARAWGSAVLGSNLETQLASIVGIYDYPNNGTGTGGQEHGWHIWMQKDLRSVLGEHVRGPFALRYCGAGKLARCAKLLWKAIDSAGNELAAVQGPNPSDWHQSATAEEIKFVPGLLSYTMRYANRPSGIQQVLSFFGHAPQDKGR